MYNGDAPAFPKLMAVYGINLKTETIYFFKNDGTEEVCANRAAHVHVPHAETQDPKLTLDSTGSMPNYQCEGGIGYETKHTKQRSLGGYCRSGACLAMHYRFNV